MTKFTVHHLDSEKREALLSWVQSEGLVPDDIADDGRFSVHNGWVSGNMIIRDDNGYVIANKRIGKILTKPFKKRQKNPLPEVLQQ